MSVFRDNPQIFEAPGPLITYGPQTSGEDHHMADSCAPLATRRPNTSGASSAANHAACSRRCEASGRAAARRSPSFEVASPGPPLPSSPAETRGSQRRHQHRAQAADTSDGHTPTPKAPVTEPAASGQPAHSASPDTGSPNIGSAINPASVSSSTSGTSMGQTNTAAGAAVRSKHTRSPAHHAAVKPGAGDSARSARDPIALNHPPPPDDDDTTTRLTPTPCIIRTIRSTTISPLRTPQGSRNLNDATRAAELLEITTRPDTSAELFFFWHDIC